MDDTITAWLEYLQTLWVGDLITTDDRQLNQPPLQKLRQKMWDIYLPFYIELRWTDPPAPPSLTHQ
jgi:hypothetical protein